jgi:hypothetical protein
MLVRTGIGGAHKNRRSSVGRGWSRFAIIGRHTCSVCGCAASWSPPSGGGLNVAALGFGTSDVVAKLLALPVFCMMIVMTRLVSFKLPAR